MKKEGRTLKQEQELFMIGAVLNGKGNPTENCISSDRPDIIIPTEDKKAIGVEVVTYIAINNAEMPIVSGFVVPKLNPTSRVRKVLLDDRRVSQH